MSDGNVEEALHSFAVAPGDCIYVPAGTVHAIGEGILLAEIQQSSDITYRLHDWNRVGPDGLPRELHLEESLKCIDFEKGPVDPVTPRRISPLPQQLEELVHCEYFSIRRHQSDQPIAVPMMVVTMIICAEIPALRAIAILLSGDGDLPGGATEQSSEQGVPPSGN